MSSDKRRCILLTRVCCFAFFPALSPFQKSSDSDGMITYRCLSRPKLIGLQSRINIGVLTIGLPAVICSIISLLKVCLLVTSQLWRLAHLEGAMCQLHIYCSIIQDNMGQSLDGPPVCVCVRACVRAELCIATLRCSGATCVHRDSYIGLQPSTTR